jgi:LysR family transcriptional activator of nhaA
LRLTIGIDAVVPREIVRRLLQASLKLEQPVQLVCRDGSLESLLGELQVRRIDVILSDSPVTPSLGLRAYNHELGGCDVSWMAVPALARPLRNGFPRSLDGVKMLLPTPNTAIRRSLDQWFDRHGIHPQVVGEFQDYGLLREFARAGHGVAPVPNVLLQQYRKDAGLSIIGPARRVQAEFHLISMERRIRHPAVLAISEKAEDIFDS